MSVDASARKGGGRASERTVPIDSPAWLA